MQHIEHLQFSTNFQSTVIKNKIDKLSKRLRREVGLAITDFNMIEEGDKVMVCLSGGKDSYVLLDILMNLQKYAPVNFELLAVNLDQKQPGFPKEVLPNYFETIGVPYRIITEDTHSLVKSIIPEGKTTCSLCSRLRRGILYRVAVEERCTKIALGHHRDDMVETLFLNMFFAGQLQTMPAKLVSDNGIHTVIRPLAYCREKDIEKYAKLKEFPIVPCNLCGSQPNLQRQIIKDMLQTWDKQHPGRIETIFRSIQNISLSHLLDRSLYDFTNLTSSSQRQFNLVYQDQNLESFQVKTKANILSSSPKTRAKHNSHQLQNTLLEATSSLDKSTETQLEVVSKQNSKASMVTASLNDNQAFINPNKLSNWTAEELAKLDDLAQNELFGDQDYDVLARQITEQALNEEDSKIKIAGLTIKQL